MSSSAEQRVDVRGLRERMLPSLPLRRDSTSAHHFDRLLGVGEVLIGLQRWVDGADAPSARGLESAVQGDAVTAPVTSMRSAGSVSGVLPTGNGRIRPPGRGVERLQVQMDRAASRTRHGALSKARRRPTPLAIDQHARRRSQRAPTWDADREQGGSRRRRH